MKVIKLLAVTLAITLIFSACSFSKDKNVTAGTGKKGYKTIVTSFYPMYIFTLNITKDVDDVKVINMTQPTIGCLHDYQLSPGDMKLLEMADVLIINGAGLESFIGDVRSRLKNSEIIDASQGLELLKTDGNHGHDEDESHGQHSINPHVWVSISGAIGQVSNIGNELAKLDPDNSEKYLSNTRIYIEKLKKLREKMHSELDNVRNRSIVTFHEAFPYFAKEFDLHTVAVVQQEPGTEPSPAELARIINIIRNTGVKSLFTEPQYSSKTAETIARETGAQIYEIDPVVTGPEEPDPDYYIQTMESNLEVLKKALE